MTKFAFLCDLHYGYERRNGHKVPLHDMRAFNCALAFLKDFKPDVLILGGDILDCGMISHHNKGKPGRTEGLRLLGDANECKAEVIAPLLALKAMQYIYQIGNHELWALDLIDECPGIEGLIDISQLLGLEKFRVIDQGEAFNLGKLTFVHGDSLKGGEHVAKAAVIAYERSIRFGHHHSFQAYTKTSALDIKLGRTGMLVPCLCHKAPKYGKGQPNRWVQGFNWGYVMPDGTYSDYVSIITNGRMIGGNGKVYQA